MYEYKVITERDSRVVGNFDLASLESTLNTYAAEGWKLAEGLLATSVWKGSRSELVMILERPV
jgi:hypothetical protein